MGGKYIVYALFVVLVTTALSWSKLIGGASRTGGSSWVSHSSGGGSYGGGYSGGHK